MTPPLATTWDTMSTHDRWLILNKTDLRGLQKCTAAAQPFRRLKSEWREKIERAEKEGK